MAVRKRSKWVDSRTIRVGDVLRDRWYPHEVVLCRVEGRNPEIRTRVFCFHDRAWWDVATWTAYQFDYRSWERIAPSMVPKAMRARPRRLPKC